MLLDRDEECSRIDRLIDDARAGTSGALLLRGEPGIGKSELLRYAVARAAGMKILRTTGFESESELPFSALSELLGPVLSYLSRIPDRQAAALSGALALAPDASGDRFAVSAGTLSVLAAAAEDRPVLAVVDDVQWLDGSSRDALAFAARRLGAEGIVILLASREQVEAFPPGAIPELALSGLPDDAAAALVESNASCEVAGDVIRALVTATAGNPLALVETPGLLSEAQLVGREPLPEPVPAGPGVKHAFLQRVSSLPARTREALIVAAALETGATDEFLAALRELGIDASALEAAEDVGLVRIEDGQIRFQHPLLRSAVYEGATARQRRAAHGALASALTASNAANAAARRAWHLARAVVGPNEEVASAMEDAAREARRRGGHAAAGSAFEFAAMITPEPQARARRLLDAARDLHVAGRVGRAVALLDASLELVGDALTRAEIHHLRARIEMFDAEPMAAHAILVREAEHVAELDRQRAAMMFAEATGPCLMAGKSREALETASRAYALAGEVGGTCELTAGVFLAAAAALTGKVPGPVQLAIAGQYRLICADPLGTFPLAHILAAALFWTDDHERAADLLTRAIAAARAASAAGLLPLLLASHSETAFRMGRWASASANASEAVVLATDTGQRSLLGFALVALARVEAGQGRLVEAEAHGTMAAQLAREAGSYSIVFHALSVMGLLSLSAGRASEAIRLLEQVAALDEDQGGLDQAVVPWAADLVESYVRAGQTEHARETLSKFSAKSEASGHVSALATAARCRGLLATDDDIDRAFEEALHWHERLPMPFEQARTEFCFGERLRRARRVAEARVMLNRALAGFERLGAAVWAERTRSELRATGARVARAAARSDRDLTAQELQVALLVAQGATNREVAAALFLSPKTVEFHLGHVYAKLGIRSRTELARTLADDGGTRRAANH
jgi:DNA-binding CsgD family transcriptional regulator